MKAYLGTLLAAALFLSGCDAYITFKPGEDGEATVATVSIAPRPPEEAKPPQKIPGDDSAPEKPAPPPRPAWVDAPPGLHGGVYETEVVVGPERSREACEAKLPPAVESATIRYVANEFHSAEDQLDLRYASLQSKVLGPTWEEHVSVDGEDAVFLHAQLRFDDQLRTGWRHKIERWTTTLRTIAVVKGFAMAMSVLLVVHLALRFAPRRASAP